jgi:DNA-binding MarR family transcriptional regulator
MDNIDDEIIDPGPLKAQGNNSLARLMLQVYRNFNASTQKRYAEMGHVGLTLAHTLLMANVDEAGIRIVALAELMGTTKQFTGRLVQDLEKRAFLTTEPDPTDKRATLVKATQAGWRYLRDACAVKNEIESSFAAALGAEHMAVFVEAIKHLAALDEANDELPLDQF